MKLNPLNDIGSADDKPDYFDGEDLPETEKEKREKYRKDDPRYWQQPPGPWEHLNGLKRARIWIWLAVALFGIMALWALYSRYLSPYAEGGVTYGYVESIERRGSVFKTFEGVLLPYRDLMDTTRLYSHDFIFSAKDAKTAADLKRFKLDGRPVKVEYVQYHTSAPWRGEAKIIITRVDTLDTSTIHL